MRYRRLYDLMSDFYGFVGLFENPYKRMAIELACLTGTERVLDCGCGNGFVMQDILGSGHDGNVCGLDFSECMVRRARNTGAGVVIGDSLEIPFVNGSFDIVFSSFVFDLFDIEGQRRMRDEISRVLSDSGRVVLVNNARGRGIFYALSGFYLFLRRMFPSVLVDRPVDTKRVFLENGGFDDVDIRVIGFTEIAVYRKRVR